MISKSNLRRRYFWLIAIFLVIGLSISLFPGYCWGLWGRRSLLLQYLFQCKCPAASEQARYPEQVEIIVPACYNGGVRLSPSGRLLLVHGKVNTVRQPYLLDLETREKTPISLPEDEKYFLTDDLIYMVYGEDIYSLTTNMMYPVQRFTTLHPEAYENGDANLDLLAEALYGSKYIYLIEGQDIVIALDQDFSTSPNRGFLTGWFDIPGMDPDRVKYFLDQNNITYQTVPANFPEEIVSKDGRFVARPDGIFLNETNEKIIEGYSATPFFRAYSRKYFMVRGWTRDNTGVIYSKFLNPCLIETNFFLLDDAACYFEVSQPVIILKVSEEYILPTNTP